MGRYSAIPARFKEARETAWDDAHADAMRALEDHASDETSELVVTLVDDPDDLQRISAMWFKTKDACAIGTLLGVILDRHAGRLADEYAEKARDAIPSDPHDTYGVSRGTL